LSINAKGEARIKRREIPDGQKKAEN